MAININKYLDIRKWDTETLENALSKDIGTELRTEIKQELKKRNKD